jgi:endogenous inhibitor of DNA gyrase (YacG/DUF329 family)
MRCPNCNKPVPPDSASRPFCSERCQLLDLGRWLDAEYVIPGRPEDPEAAPSERDDD